MLLVDRASRYGGSLDAAEDLLQLKHQNENSTVILEEFESALAADHLNKHFILDRRPIVILSGGPVCDLLIESDVTDYLQFRPIEKYGVYTSEGLVMVPTSKEDIFVDPTLSLPEKRKISKLVNLTDAAEIQQPGGAAFADYLETLGLTPRLKELVMVGIAGCQSGDDVEVCSVSRALTSIKSYRLGLGMYAANCSPFLYPVYGSSEIAQAFSRQCAVNGGTFVMGQAKLLRGTTDISGTFEEHRWRATFAALRAPPEHPRTCLRAIAILRSPLNGMSRTSLWRISPLSPINKCGKTISILVLGPDSSCCPNGYCMHLIPHFRAISLMHYNRTSCHACLVSKGG